MTIKMIESQQPELRSITLDLIRKRSEHNESLVSTLEEIALHQEELQCIGPVLGRSSGKTLKILLLQNNVIQRMNPSHFKHFKALTYLNLALNNILVIEGIEHMEFLEKLDMTLNFIDFDTLRQSIACLQPLRSLRYLYMMGNPCCFSCDENIIDPSSKLNGMINDLSTANYDVGKSSLHEKDSNTYNSWKGFRMYIVAKLPQLRFLDGKEILKSERIKAIQMLNQLESELSKLGEITARHKQECLTHDTHGKTTPVNEDVYNHSPQARTKMSDEMAKQKLEKNKRETANFPKYKGEEEFIKEHHEAIRNTRQKEHSMLIKKQEMRENLIPSCYDDAIKQCNEGKWKFTLDDEETKKGFLLLDVAIQKHLSSSLIDVDVHPTYISIVIKSKLLRLRLPSEVNSVKSTAQRSTTTGHLLVTMPKCHVSKECITTVDYHHQTVPFSPSNKTSCADEHVTKNAPDKLSHQLLNDAEQKYVKGNITLSDIYQITKDERITLPSRHGQIDLTEVSTTSSHSTSTSKCNDENNNIENGIQKRRCESGDSSISFSCSEPPLPL